MTTNATIASEVIHDDLERARMIAALRLEPILDDKGRELIVIVKRWEPNRSLKQNALWQAWTSILAAHTGATHGEMKRALQRELLGEVPVANPITGEVQMEPKPTEDLLVDEMKALLDRLHPFALEFFGVDLPPAKDKTAWAAYRNTAAKAA